MIEKGFVRLLTRPEIDDLARRVAVGVHLQRGLGPQGVLGSLRHHAAVEHLLSPPW